MQDKHYRSRSLFLDSLSLFFPLKKLLLLLLLYYYYNNNNNNNNYYYYYYVKKTWFLYNTIKKKII